MKTDGESRSLEERERLALNERTYWRAREDYEAARNAAKSDDTSAFLAAARAFLPIARTYFGGTPGFAALEREIQRDVERLGVDLEPKKKGAKS